MASGNSSPQPGTETKESEREKAEDDPRISIKKMLGIVESLDKIFPSQKPPEQEENRVFRAMSDVGKTSSPTENNSQPQGPDRTQSLPPPAPPNQDGSENSILKLKRNLRLMKDDVRKLLELNVDVREEVSRQIRPLEKLLNQVEADNSKNKLTKGDKTDLDKVNKKIFNLMCQVPLLPNKRNKPKGIGSDDGDKINFGKEISCLPGIHANEEDLKRLAVFRDVLDKFDGLKEVVRKICLLSFAVFPENQEVNRTMLMYWWIGEGILPVLGAEDKVKEILDEFTKKKLIEPVENKRKVEPSSYKMTPFVHASLVLISTKIKLFDIYQKGVKPAMKTSELNKVCLVEGSSSQQEAKAKKMAAENIDSVFNVSERFPDFTFKWFSEDKPSRSKLNLSTPTYKALKVFYLGRWERTANRHIEVENPELMKNLKHMTKLKLLSFQGISRIERLDDAVCKLRDLIILDLRACYNLEKLPDKIDSLKALIYLDITDCYMIDRMPKRLSWLNNLEVLKGFVVSDAIDEETFCTLAELKHLEKLRKLSLSINKENFSISDVFVAVKNFKKLEKLKVAWGGINKDPGAADRKKATAGMVQRTATMIFGGEKKVPEIPELPPTLKKLDLQCFPDTETELPPWLGPNNLGGLEKLYIKGGTNLTRFGKSPPEKPTECKVKVLRLKFLPRLKVEWRQLTELYFPQLEFLDKYQCPQVSFCPTDGIGIWRKTDHVEATLN